MASVLKMASPGCGRSPTEPPRTLPQRAPVRRPARAASAWHLVGFIPRGAAAGMGVCPENGLPRLWPVSDRATSYLATAGTVRRPARAASAGAWWVSSPVAPRPAWASVLKMASPGCGRSPTEPPRTLPQRAPVRRPARAASAWRGWVFIVPQRPRLRLRPTAAATNNAAAVTAAVPKPMRHSDGSKRNSTWWSPAGSTTPWNA